MIIVNFHLVGIVLFWNGELNSFNNILEIKNIKKCQMKKKSYDCCYVFVIIIITLQFLSECNKTSCTRATLEYLIYHVKNV